MSYRKIASALYINPMSVFAAMRRHAQRGQHVDLRQFNGKNNPKQKITPELKLRLLDRKLLQEWSGLTLEQRCVLIEKDFNVKIATTTLCDFYRANGVRYLAVSYIYAQSLERGCDAVENFGLRLAKAIASG
jgi:transposase